MSAAVCWCGRSALPVFGGGFLECRCGTLVWATPPPGDITAVTDDARDFYGRKYWFEHQLELGLPTLDARATSDLTDRCLAWLDLVLRYRRPPGRVLEIGAGHGVFLALLAGAGFDAVGLELSPWVVERARRRGLHMRHGPVERQALADGAFDLIVAFDVLEHLPDPLGTLSRCAELLTADGLIVLQTPRRPPGTFEQLAPLPFRRMLIAEHLFLFSDDSVRALLAGAGLAHVVEEPSVFDTDMTLVAGRRVPIAIGRPEPDAAANARPGPAHVLDVLVQVGATLRETRADAARRLEALDAAYRQADHDRRERLHTIETIGAELAQADRDRIHRQYRIEDLDRVLAEREKEQAAATGHAQALRDALAAAAREADDRAARLAELQAEVDALHAGLATLRTEITELRAGLDAAGRVRLEQLARIELLEHALATAETERRQTVDAAGRMREAVEREREAVERERDGVALARQALEEQLARLRARLVAADTGRWAASQRVRSAERAHRALGERHDALTAIAVDHRNSRVYQAMVRAGRWKAHDARLQALLDAPPDAVRRGHSLVEREWDLRLTPATTDGVVAVDLTALRPGGHNGGAKLVACTAVARLAALAPARQWLLLTSAAAHDELAWLDGPTVTRRRVEPSRSTLSEVLAETPVSAVFCPMTSPAFDDPCVPLVTVVHDLQVLTYPEFFDDVERADRLHAIDHVARYADRVVVQSQYVSASVQAHTALPAEHVLTAPLTLAATRLERPTPARVADVLERYGLRRDGYFLYPANFWAHKNHAMLLVAFAKLLSRGLDGQVRLVLSGAPGGQEDTVQAAIERMGLTNAVTAPGYVADGDLAALMAGALAVVVPSLYEGFGIPVLEAFAAGCPVACSDVTALPEVAGDAALLFDPRRPDAIADALEVLATQVDTRDDLRRRGAARLAALRAGVPEAEVYLQALDAVIGRPRRPRSELARVYDDHWTMGSFVVAHAGGRATLDLALENPRGEAVEVQADGNAPITLSPGQGVRLRCTLPLEAGCVEFGVSSTFRPSDDGVSTDHRRLGLRVWRCLHVADGGRTDDLLGRGR